MREFLRERYTRGKLFGDLRADWDRLGRSRVLFFLAFSLAPIRLARILLLVAGHCRGAGMLGDFFATLPLVALGHQASLLGECAAYLRRLPRGASRASKES